MPMLLPLAGGFPPGPQSFPTDPFRYLLQAAVALVVAIVFWVVLARRLKVVPTKGQFIGESIYDLVRNGIARDTIGPDFVKFLPLLLGLFSFVLINNLFGIFPLTLLPTFGHVGWAYGLAIMVWVVYNAVGIRKHGVFGYIKHTTLPGGVPGWMWPIIIPLEFISNIVFRPLTLALRLFGNMFSGHLLVLVFVLGGELLLVEGAGALKIAGAGSLLFSLAIFGLEAFVQCLQAFIFTILTAVYIQSALADEH